MDAKVIFVTEVQLKAYIADAVHEGLNTALKKIQPTGAVGSPPLPILSSEQVKEMTGWPDGTFYRKVNEMPDGIVIRGKSKRLLFDRERLISWLQTPVEP